MVHTEHPAHPDWNFFKKLSSNPIRPTAPCISLPAPLSPSSSDGATSPHSQSLPRNPETYLGVERAQYFSNPAGEYTAGAHDFARAEPAGLHYSLEGPWALEEQSIRAGGRDARLHLKYRAARVQLVVSGRGEVRVTFGDGTERSFAVTADGTVDLLKKADNQRGELTVQTTGDVEPYPFTFG